MTKENNTRAQIENWFSYKPSMIFEKFHFVQDENGKEVFYPLGCPGDGYYVDSKQKKRINSIYLMTTLFQGVCLLICVFLTFPSLGEFVIILSITLWGSCIFFFSCISFYKKKWEPCHNKDIRNEYSGINQAFIEKYFIFLSAFNFLILLELTNPNSSQITWLLGIAVITINPLLLFQIYQKSFIFQKPENKELDYFNQPQSKTRRIGRRIGTALLVVSFLLVMGGIYLLKMP